MSTTDKYDLQNTLMQLKSKYNKVYLFLGINWDENKSGYKFTFGKKIEDDTCDMIA